MDPLIIRRNRVVHLSLRVTDADAGVTLEETGADGQHFVYLHGHGNLVPPLEEALTGLKPGDAFEVSVADAYGARLPEACRRFDRNLVDLPAHCAVGQRITTHGPHGQIEFSVVSLDKDTVTLDANHPLAGRTLHYAGQVLRVLRAHKDEIRHHRPHPAGHHLMVHDSSFVGKIHPAIQGPQNGELDRNTTVTRSAQSSSAISRRNAQHDNPE